MDVETRRREVIPKFFAQTNSVNPSEGVQQPILPHFGLLDDSPERWFKFTRSFEELVESSKEDLKTSPSYKLFILGRHGEGWHNVAEHKYGSKRWNEYWAKFPAGTDGEIVFGPDPELTPLGESQAAFAKTIWQAELGAGMPAPELFLVSPLSRAIRTHKITFEGVFDQQAMIWDHCREEFGVHLCDKRRSKSGIHEIFPEYGFEEGFAEEDEIWTEEHRETHEEANQRVKLVIDRIFESEQASVISITAHSGFINAFLNATGHQRYQLGTGGIIPVVIKSTIETTKETQ